MLIRCRGYNDGVKEYLEEGAKTGRDKTRDELDLRVILDGDLDLTKAVYQAIPNKGQDRYLSFTLSFREDHISEAVLKNISDDFKAFIMSAYKPEEYNFYSEAHIPKIKSVFDKKTGEVIERKPHIHIVIPKLNLLSGNIFEAVGSSFSQSEKFIEAFQEKINKKYNLASPREHVRINPQDVSSILSRYKGDDFRGRHREFKMELVSLVVNKNITTRKGFYDLVGSYGETKVRNAGRDNEYIAVKLPGDAKFTNLKETIFQDGFVVNRKLTKPELPSSVIEKRLLEWEVRSKEIKYISKATPSFRKYYAGADSDEKRLLLKQRESDFYDRNKPESIFGGKRSRDRKPRVVESESRSAGRVSISLQDMPSSDVASPRSSDKVLLQNDVRVHMGNKQATGNSGLRRPIRERRGGDRVRTGRGRAQRVVGEVPTPNPSGGTRTRSGTRAGIPGAGVTPPPFLRRGRVASLADIDKRSDALFSPLMNNAEGEGARRSSGRKGRHSWPTKSSINAVRPSFLRGAKIPTLDDVKKRSDRLNSRSSSESIYLTRPVISHGAAASTLPSWLLRRYEQDQLSPGYKASINLIRRDYFERRRELMSDNRLTANEKKQLLSVMNFELLKSKYAVKEKYEGINMGSADIKDMKRTLGKETPDYSISAGPARARERMRRITEELKKTVDQKTVKENSEKLDAKQVYTKRSRQGHVHYLSKVTDKTLFVDTGAAICLRRTGLDVGAVGIALELAIGRFGSTLDIKGSKEFKAQVVDAAIKLNLDVHFTDKAMNEQLSTRRTELDLERDGNRVQSGDQEQAREGDQEQAREGDQEQAREGDQEQAREGGQEQAKASALSGILVERGSAPYRNDPKNETSYYVVLRTSVGSRTIWGAGLESALNEKDAKIGQSVTLIDLGTQPVTIREPVGDGTYIERIGQRRDWSAEVEVNQASPDQVPSANLPSKRALEMAQEVQRLKSQSQVQDSDEQELNI
jgi:hypothetical protein